MSVLARDVDEERVLIVLDANAVQGVAFFLETAYGPPTSYASYE
jgi:hypothetical protein